jgi:uroporphyrinogen-III synthase
LTVRLILTRPEPDAERTAAVLRARGHFVVVAPLLRIEVLADAEIGGGPWAAILVTSANVAPAIAAHKRFAELRTLPVYAVGERSAQAMRAAGFADVSSAEGGASALSRLAAERLKQGVPLLYLAGADRSGDIVGDLSAQNFVVSTALVYRAFAASVLPRPATDALASGIDGVLHFSRRSAETYVNVTRAAGLHEPALKKPAHFCLSAQIAEPLLQAGAADIRVPPQPAEAALIALIPAV